MFRKVISNGSDASFVFLHGFLGNASDWRTVISHLKNHTCIAFDLPGHGNTPWTDEKIEDLLSHAIAPEPVNLIGYSLGGRLALRFALNNPSRIHSLTLLSTHYGLCPAKAKQSRLQADQIWAQKIISLPFDDFLFEWYNQPIFASLRNNLDLMNQILFLRKKQKPQELAKVLLNCSLGHQDCYRDQLKTFPRPYQILYGEKDKKLSRLYSNWPKAVCIPEAGHILHLESPKKIAHLIERLARA